MILRAALSTMWMLNRHKSLGEFFEAAHEIGFDRFELNHFVSQDLVNGTKFPGDAIRSVHAPCPTDPRTRDAEVSSLDKAERDLAVEAVTASISLAERIGAQAVILHAGFVAVNPESEKELRVLYNRGHRGSARYADVQTELMEERARRAERHLDATRHALERLASTADSAGVRIALENRFFYNEIPQPDELDLILKEFAGPVGFWFDTGHAYTLEELGFVHHREWLNGFGTHLIGTHLHDVQVVPQDAPPAKSPLASWAKSPGVVEGGTDQLPDEKRRLRDHLVPGTGIVDFAEIVPSANESLLVTAEIDWYHSPEEVKAALDYLRRVGLS